MRLLSRKFLRVLMLGNVVAVLAFAGPALAQSSQEGYAGPGGNVQSEIEPGSGTNDGVAVAGTDQATPAATPAAKDDGNLPFTGLDLAVLITAGIALLLVGVGLRRVVQRQPS